MKRLLMFAVVPVFMLAAACAKARLARCLATLTIASLALAAFQPATHAQGLVVGRLVKESAIEAVLED